MPDTMLEVEDVTVNTTEKVSVPTVYIQVVGNKNKKTSD